MSQHKKKWKCKWCGNSNAGGKWCVEYFPTIPTLNKLERLRLNQLTLETWDNQKAAENRVLALQIHFGHIRTLLNLSCSFLMSVTTYPAKSDQMRQE